MEAGLHGVDRLDPAVLGEKCVERAAEAVRGPGSRGGKADGESRGVYPGVGAPGRRGRRVLPQQALEHALELGLHRPSGGLALPPDEPGSVELQRSEKGPAHRPGI